MNDFVFFKYFGKWACGVIPRDSITHSLQHFSTARKRPLPFDVTRNLKAILSVAHVTERVFFST